MKKKWIRTIATISLFIMLTPLFGCEPGDLETESDSAGTETGPSTVQSNDEKKLEDLASQLLNSQIFSENMTAASPSAIPAIYGCTGLVRNAVSYAGSMATAEEFILFEAENTEAALQIAEKIEAYHKKQTDDFADYRPSEVPKLSEAVMQTDGVYYIYCVSNDGDKAAKIIGDWLKSS